MNSILHCGSGGSRSFAGDGVKSARIRIISQLIFKKKFTFITSRNYSATATSSNSNSNSNSAHIWYRTCDKPTTEPVEGQVTGNIPKWLEGTLIRNGSGIFKVGNDTYNHLFDGLSVLHRYHISNGQATYTSRALESDAYKKNMKANRIVVSEFGTAAIPDPCQSLFQRFQSNFSTLKGNPNDMTDNCAVTVGYYGDQLYAMTETNYIRRIDPTDLKVIGDKTRLGDYVAVNHASAHPHVLPDGSVLNVGYNYRHKNGPHYCLIKVPPTFGSDETSYKGAKIVGEIPFSSQRYPCYYHSFGLTKNNIIFIETPLRMDLVKIMKAALTRTPFSATIAWNPDLKTKFHVVSLKDGSRNSVVYEADGFFTFHHINAFEEDGNIVVDVAGYDSGAILSSMEIAKIETVSDIGSKATARRFVLPLNVPKDAAPGENLVTLKTSTSGKSYLNPRPTPKSNKSENKNKDGDGPRRVHCESYNLTSIWQELPRINYKYNGDKYNYFYALSSSQQPTWSTPQPNLITKTDISQNDTKCWSEEGKIPSEPIFVSNPNPNSNSDPKSGSGSGSGDEDDGVILSALMHKNEEAAVDLLVLNAKDMKELGRVQFKTAGTFPFTFHGQWAQQGEKIHGF